MTNLVVRRNNGRAVNPWKEMDKMINDFSRAYEASPRKPIVHIENEESRVVLTAELPGFAAEDLDIQVKENLLTIQALERAEKKKEEDKVVFERSFVLPEDLQSDRIEAEMKHGLLTLELPRKEKPAPLAVKVKG
ncbi:MAG: Hsp20/alpha crystallin family protein [Spirochaetales bacterium]|nr:Hsp20/alpha crystallin family protein [Spirochaetales bacterium]